MECAKGDPAGNERVLREAALVRERVLREAAESGCQIAVFPEMSLSGSVDPATRSEWLLALSSP